MTINTFWHKVLRRPYRLHVSYHGDATKPPIIMLHGIGTSGDAWLPLIKTLQQTHYCITIDLLGFGESPKPEWAAYTMEDHIRSVRRTIRRLGLKTPYILMGHSLGSMIAARYARLYPQRISRVCMLSTPVYPPLGSINKRRAKRLTGLLLKAYQFMRSEQMTPALFDKISRILPLPRDIIDNPASWMPFMKTLEHCIEQQDVIGDVAAITIQTDVWHGVFDQFVIDANVTLLAENPHVTVHSFVGDHSLTKKYGHIIAKVLTNENANP